MANVYARLSKIHNAVGRSNYINNDERNDVFLHKAQMEYSWQFHSEFEKSQRQGKKKDGLDREALEIVVALPPELYKYPKKLRAVCDDLSKALIQGNNDYEYSVHRPRENNLHMHLLFSERENVLERTPKVYAKDIWQDKDTHKLAKAGASNAELVHRKGEIQKDKDGNIKYKDEPFTAKNKIYKDKAYIKDKSFIVQRVLFEHGFDLNVQDEFTPYLSQKKLYKNAPEEYIRLAKEYNQAVKAYNEAVREHIKLDSSMEEEYIWERQNIESDIRFENQLEIKADPEERPRLSPRAVGVIRDKLYAVLEVLKAYKDRIAQKIVPKAQEKPVVKKITAPEPKQQTTQEPKPQFPNKVSPEKKESVREKLARLQKEVKEKPKPKKEKRRGIER